MIPHPRLEFNPFRLLCPPQAGLSVWPWLVVTDKRRVRVGGSFSGEEHPHRFQGTLKRMEDEP